ncbi:MAG: adenosylcobinamide-GDP ribazoletransferase [Pseudomonadota bacterium]
MQEIGRVFRGTDMLMALALLTRLPLPHVSFTGRSPAAAAWAYPLAGLVVGVLAAVMGALALWLGLPEPITAALVLVTGVLLTGAMHEDGLADCADGFWGGWTVERRLEIMKDSAIGTYGVIALTKSLLVRWSALTLLIEADYLAAGVIVAAVMSRATMVWVMRWLPNVRKGGLAAQTGRPSGTAVMIAVLLGIAAPLAAPGTPTLTLVACVGLAAVVCGLIARAKIGGQTGDVLGATQQVCEVTALAVFAAASV